VARPLAASLLLAALACAGPGRSSRGEAAPDDLPARLAARGVSLLGHAGAFHAGGERFNADCSGFVEAVYAGEGVPLRRLAARAAPSETSGVAALYQAVKAHGVVFGGGGEWPAPGDLVFFHDTYDRDRDGRPDDPFTHVGLVEYVSRDGTVVFLHRGGKTVVRAAVTPARPEVATDPDGTIRNSPMRDKRPALVGAPTLAGQLFAGYGRLDPGKLGRGRNP
jgi:probable lipoprotein NlpC